MRLSEAPEGLAEGHAAGGISAPGATAAPLRAEGDAERPALPSAAWERVLFGANAALALAVAFVLCLLPIAVTDFWWQARTGELILRTGAIPRRDPFSWTAHGQPWVVHEWLTEVLFYLALTRLLEGALLLYKAGLGALACGLVLLRAWRRSGSALLAVAATVAAAAVVRNYADLRPQMISFVLLALLLLGLDAHRRGRAPRLPWLLPPLFALWANLHGGVVVGLLLLLLWTAGDAIEAWLLPEGRRASAGGFGTARAAGRGASGRALALGAAGAAVAVLLNPHGVRIYAYPFEVLGHPEVVDYISEWLSPNFHGGTHRVFELLLLGTFGLLALARRPAGVGLGEVLVLAALAHAALFAQRNTVFFALAAAPVAAACAGALWRELALPLGLRRFFAAPALRAASGLLLAAGLLWLGFVHLPRESGRLLPPGAWYAHATLQRSFPRAAAERMARGEWPGRLYNDYAWGGYLIWRLYPQRRVFIDGRAEVYYRTRAFDDEMTIHRVAPGWQEALDRRGVEVILTDRWGALARALEAAPHRWKRVFTGEVEVVYLRAELASSSAPGPLRARSTLPGRP